MALTLTILAVLSIALTLRGVRQAQYRLRHTTLVPAGRWAMTAALVWTAALIADSGSMFDAKLRDALWYTAALLAVCPSIAVLGARRPGAGAWTCFVVLPLLAVLGWPLLTLFAHGAGVHSLRLETPQLVGFVLVLLMGAGNYLGTRFGLPTACYVVALCLTAGTVSAVASPSVQGSLIARQLASVCLGLSVVMAVRLSLREHPVDSPSDIDRLWCDYRDTFGIVWARRFQDRLNDVAGQQQWSARLGEAGIEWQTTDDESRHQTSARIDQTFRWLLRRFVDPAWIEQRRQGLEELSKNDPRQNNESGERWASAR